MTIKLIALVLLCLMTGTAVAQEPKVTALMSKDLPESPGREALMITVEHAPGGSSAIHRHNAHAFVYVLEGSVVMQLKGGQQVTLTPGQSFYEDFGAARIEIGDDGVCVEGLVGDQGAKGDAVDEWRHANRVEAMSWQQLKAHEVAQRIGQRQNLGRHAAFGTADGLARSPPFAPCPW